MVGLDFGKLLNQITVNYPMYSDVGVNKNPISSITTNGSEATISTVNPHGLAVNKAFSIIGVFTENSLSDVTYDAVTGIATGKLPAANTIYITLKEVNVTGDYVGPAELLNITTTSSVVSIKLPTGLTIANLTISNKMYGFINAAHKVKEVIDDTTIKIDFTGEFSYTGGSLCSVSFRMGVNFDTFFNRIVEKNNCFPIMYLDYRSNTTQPNLRSDNASGYNQTGSMKYSATRAFNVYYIDKVTDNRPGAAIMDDVVNQVEPALMRALYNYKGLYECGTPVQYAGSQFVQTEKDNIVMCEFNFAIEYTIDEHDGVQDYKLFKVNEYIQDIKFKLQIEE